jgi:PIN domain nuclease of toxin-antitoxin system
MTDNPKFSIEARSIFRKVDDAKEHIFIPCIVFFELLYLIEKNKVAVDFDSFLMMVSSSRNYRIEPLCLPIIEESRKISREKIPDPWDRLIAATSMHFDKY